MHADECSSGHETWATFSACVFSIGWYLLYIRPVTEVSPASYDILNCSIAPEVFFSQERTDPSYAIESSGKEEQLCYSIPSLWIVQSQVSGKLPLYCLCKAVSARVCIGTELYPPTTRSLPSANLSGTVPSTLGLMKGILFAGTSLANEYRSPGPPQNTLSSLLPYALVQEQNDSISINGPQMHDPGSEVPAPSRPDGLAHLEVKTGYFMTNGTRRQSHPSWMIQLWIMYKTNGMRRILVNKIFRTRSVHFSFAPSLGLRNNVNRKKKIKVINQS